MDNWKKNTPTRKIF